MRPAPTERRCINVGQRRGVGKVALSLVLALLAGCALTQQPLPDVSARQPMRALAPATDGLLARVAAASVSGSAMSGFKLLASGREALQARLALIRHAQSSLDLQVYQFKGDDTGCLLWRALRDAAARGVRVRILLDDLYTAGSDPMWMELATHDGIGVRLFNPFLSARASHLSRLVESALGDDRMHRRMHNKMFIADGVLAIAGGRNIADAYFLRDADEGFFDFDLLMAGDVLPPMGRAFDLYWNSEYSHSIESVTAAASPAPAQPETPACSVADPTALPLDLAGGDRAEQFDLSRLSLRIAPARIAVDSPDKLRGTQPMPTFDQLDVSTAKVRLLVAQAVRQAQHEMVLVSPYLIPGPAGIAALHSFHERGVKVSLLTNSLAATDEKLVHLGYRKYRVAILREGAQLYEWSPVRAGRVWRELLVGGTVLRLHAKCAVIDRRVVYLGSMNFDPRSRDWNTEFGLLVESPELAADVLALIERMQREGAMRVVLDADGETLRWRSGDDLEDIGEFEPDTDLGSRLLLDLLAPFVPEEML